MICSSGLSDLESGIARVKNGDAHSHGRASPRSCGKALRARTKLLLAELDRSFVEEAVTEKKRRPPARGGGNTGGRLSSATGDRVAGGRTTRRSRRLSV